MSVMDLEEEKRYSKAYGGGALEFEQYMELVKDAKKRKKGFQKEIEEQEVLTSKESIDIGWMNYALRQKKSYAP